MPPIDEWLKLLVGIGVIIGLTYIVILFGTRINLPM